MNLESPSTVVIGAGPYGLSAAAHLQGQGASMQVFGSPMEFWRGMPAGMYLKSPWSASSLSAPGGAGSLKRYLGATGATRVEPIPLGFFLDYAGWFARRFVPPVDPTPVRRLTRTAGGFVVELADGRQLGTRRVVVAVGIRSFTHVPEFADGLPAEVAFHTQARSDLEAFHGRRVAVVGSGQSGLEWAALLHEGGAQVELLSRKPVAWVNRALYNHTGPARHLFYPPTDVGPPGINWLIAFPLLLRRLPPRARLALHRRAVRPAGAKWLRPRVESRIRITAPASIRGVTVSGAGVRLELADGSWREVDHLCLGTGYRPRLDRIGFLDPGLLQQVRQRNGFPVLDRWFQSSVPNLHFIGGVAGYSFGPLCNFVSGADVAARQVARRARLDR